MEWKEKFEIIKEIASKKLPGYGGTFSLSRLDQMLGIKKGRSQYWNKGNPPGYDGLQIIAEVLDINCQWLLLGIGEPQGEPQIHAEERPPESVQFMREAEKLIIERGGTDRDVVDMVKSLAGAPPAQAAPRTPRRTVGLIQEPRIITEPEPEPAPPPATSPPREHGTDGAELDS